MYAKGQGQPLIIIVNRVDTVSALLVLKSSVDREDHIFNSVLILYFLSICQLMNMNNITLYLNVTSLFDFSAQNNIFYFLCVKIKVFILFTIFLIISNLLILQSQQFIICTLSVIAGLTLSSEILISMGLGGILRFPTYSKEIIFVFPQNNPSLWGNQLLEGSV